MRLSFLLPADRPLVLCARAANRDTFLGYVDRWYRPERMVVGLGGLLEGDPL